MLTITVKFAKLRIVKSVTEMENVKLVNLDPAKLMESVKINVPLEKSCLKNREINVSNVLTVVMIALMILSVMLENVISIANLLNSYLRKNVLKNVPSLI